MHKNYVLRKKMSIFASIFLIQMNKWIGLLIYSLRRIL